MRNNYLNPCFSSNYFNLSLFKLWLYSCKNNSSHWITTLFYNIKLFSKSHFLLLQYDPSTPEYTWKTPSMPFFTTYFRVPIMPLQKHGGWVFITSITPLRSVVRPLHFWESKQDKSCVAVDFTPCRSITKIKRRMTEPVPESEKTLENVSFNTTALWRYVVCVLCSYTGAD